MRFSGLEPSDLVPSSTHGGWCTWPRDRYWNEVGREREGRDGWMDFGDAEFQKAGGGPTSRRSARMRLDQVLILFGWYSSHLSPSRVKKLYHWGPPLEFLGIRRRVVDQPTAK